MVRPGDGVPRNIGIVTGSRVWDWAAEPTTPVVSVTAEVGARRWGVADTDCGTLSSAVGKTLMRATSSQRGTCRVLAVIRRDCEQRRGCR